MTSRDDNAGREPLNVPLPGCRQGFVEIVDVSKKMLRSGVAKPPKFIR
jgi:hypothetical protein